MMGNNELFTGVAREIIDSLGEEDGLKLIATLGGIKIHIPALSGSKGVNWRLFLRRHLGEALATKLMTEFGGNNLVVPACAREKNAARDNRIRLEFEELCRAGLATRPSLAALSARYGVSGTHIWNIVNR